MRVGSLSIVLTSQAGTAPVGGAALDQVIGLTAGAGVVTLVLLFIAWQHRTHRIEWFQKLGDTAGRATMALALMAMWFCGLSSVTSASRTLYAFARDRGIPGSRLIGQVNGTTRTPVVAIALVSSVAIASAATVVESAPSSTKGRTAMLGMVGATGGRETAGAAGVDWR